jgi:hypothetical protein
MNENGCSPGERFITLTSNRAKGFHSGVKSFATVILSGPNPMVPILHKGLHSCQGLNITKNKRL